MDEYAPDTPGGLPAFLDACQLLGTMVDSLISEGTLTSHGSEDIGLPSFPEHSGTPAA